LIWRKCLTNFLAGLMMKRSYLLMYLNSASITS
jgi:hypothetical protein